ncbi:MAG: sigma factor-like helix-turn-helix DNA-binding protein [Patescibacteria group bacterium]
MTNGQDSILDKIITTQQYSRKEQFRPQEILANILKALTEREAQVIARRFGLPDKEQETLENVGKSFQITRERVRQIEKLVINKINKSAKLRELISPVSSIIVESIESEGGAVTEEHLLRLLSDAANQDMPVHTIKFYLFELLNDVVKPVGYDDNEFKPGWLLQNASSEVLRTLLQSAFDILEQASSPVSDESLANKLIQSKAVGPLGNQINDAKIILSLLELGTLIKRNPYGEWGLSSWETITPKRMSDKIYLVLKKSGKPLHFREITKLINEQKFDHKQAHAPTVHNELILDKRYVLVGRGIYALKEWGYEPGIVLEVIIKVLQEKNIPLSRDEIVAEVLNRRLVQDGTIYLALTNKKYFNRTEQGKYQLINQL